MIQNYGTGPPVPPGGIFDLNLTLNFAPQMRKEYLDFLYTTREMAMKQLFDVQWFAVAGIAFVVGLILATAVSCLLAAWGRRARVATIAALLAALLGAMPVAAQDAPPSREPMVDLVTLNYVKKNLASRINNAGCCVFASQDASFRSQYRDDMDGYLEWVAANLPGGGYPSRVVEYIDAFCRAKNIAIPDYTQVVGEESLDAIREALEDGRSPAITYSGDPSFYGGPVPHMVNCVYLDDQYAGVVDNNRPDRVEWMSRDTFVKRHRHYDRGWAIIYHGKPQLCRPVNPDSRPANPLRNPRDPYRNLRVSLTREGDANLDVMLCQCPGGNCPQPSRYVPASPQPATQAGYEWRGTVLYRDNCRIGEMIDGVYHDYHTDGAGRHWNEPARCPAPGYEGVGSRLTGVDYAKVPTPPPGHTFYGTQSSDLRYDDAGRRLYTAKMNGDRVKPRIIINLDGAEDAILAILERLKALERVFIYARDAIEVIRRLGYGTGITVVSGTTRGVAVETAYFESVPTDAELREALIKADPTYRPGSSGVGAGSLDTPAMALVAVIAILAACVVYLVTRKGGSGD